MRKHGHFSLFNITRLRFLAECLERSSDPRVKAIRMAAAIRRASTEVDSMLFRTCSELAPSLLRA